MSSLLDSLVADTTGRKVAATLTPVGTEVRKPRIPDVPAVFLTNEAIIDIAKDLRQQAIVLNTVASGLEDLAGFTEEPVKAHVVDAQKVREREADARAAAEEPFKERYDRLSKDAQDAAYAGNLVPAAVEVFADLQLPPPVVDILPAIQHAMSGSVSKGWVCPSHGSTNLLQTTSRKGRDYTMCATCNQFEK